MYDRDMPLIAEHGLASPEGLLDVITFVLLTIRQPLAGVPRQFADVKRRGEKSAYLFGAKRDGFIYADTFKASLFAKVSAAIKAQDTVAGIDALLDVPSLGLVKAAFVMQCLGAPDAACIDTHNLTRFRLSPTAFKFNKDAIKRRQTRLNKIRDYIDFAVERGTSQWFWDSWCEYVVRPEAKRTSGFASAEECSRCHVRALGLA